MQVSEVLRDHAERRAKLYEPIRKWCELRYADPKPDQPAVDIDAEFYRALDKVVRLDDYHPEDVAEILAAHFCSELDFPEGAAYYEELCAAAKAIREFVVARGEVRGSQPRT